MERGGRPVGRGPEPSYGTGSGGRYARVGSPLLGVLGAPGAAVGLGLGVFAFYFLVYRVRRFPVPVGFDTSWYVWRARFVAEQGLGPLGTAIRPGHALLASVLGSTTGTSQLELAVVLPLVLVSVFALALGALASVGLGAERWRWAVAVAVAGTLLGTTRLVGENVANLLMLALVAAALAALGRWVGGGPGLAGAIALLVAGGLAHWTFLAVVGVAVAVAALLALPSSRRRLTEGVPLVRTESGALAAAAGGTALLLAGVVLGVLRASFSTFEIKEEQRRFLPKLREDLSHLFLPMTGPVAAAGTWALATGRDSRPLDPQGRSRRRFVLRILVAWTAVTVAGIAYGVATRNLPPHRFLAMLVAVPGSLALAAAVWWLGSAVARGTARFGTGTSTACGALAAMVAVGILAVPGAMAWYRHGPGIWLDHETLVESEIAGAYVRTLPQGTPVVFLVGPLGPAGLISIPLKERNIRVGMPTDREVDVHLFAGEPADLLAGRRTHVSAPVDREIEPYWRDVRTVLPRRPAVIVLESLGHEQFDATVAMGARSIGPGVALLRGPAPAAPLPPQPVRRPVPRAPTGLVLGLALLALMVVAGLGWTGVILGRDAPPHVLWSMAPAVGAGALILGGLVAAKIGIRLAGAGGVITYATVTVLGAVSASGMRRGSAAYSR